MTSITLKKNAVRAARKLLADGKAPAPAFEIKTAATIGWDIIPAGDNCPSEAKAAAAQAELGETYPIEANGECAARRVPAGPVLGAAEEPLAVASVELFERIQTAPRPPCGITALPSAMPGIRSSRRRLRV